MNSQLSRGVWKFVSTAIIATLCSGCTTGPSGERVDNIPRYGQPDLIRPESFRQLDDKFINEAVAGMGTRENASNVWWAVAEEFMAQNNLDFAMRRYNQSWLLNPKNFKAYWGFGRVHLARGETRLAVAELESAISLCDDRFQRPALLTDAGTAFSARAMESTGVDRDAYFDRANALFEDAVKVDSEYGNGYKRWAISLFRQENYREAWIKVSEGRKRAGTIFSPSFLKDLESKFPEPRSGG